MPQSSGEVYGPSWQFGSLALAFAFEHEMQFGSPGFVLHWDVPRGGLKPVLMK
jgi:hypothetical protein